MTRRRVTSSRPRRRKSVDGTTKAIVVLVLAIAVVGFMYIKSFSSAAPRPIRCIASGQRVDAIEVDPALTEIKPVMAQKSEGSKGEAFRDMIERLKPSAAINGTFFDEDLRLLGDILVDGKIVNKGHYPNGLGITVDGKVKFVRGTKRSIDWKGCKSGIAAGPMLIHDGKVEINPNADGFTKASLKIRARRSGVGITKEGKLILATTQIPMTLAEFGDDLRRLGAVEAMNLDGGSACGLYTKDRTFATPHVHMASMLMVYEKE